MSAEHWDPTALTAMVWAKQLLAERNLTDPPPEWLWQRAVAGSDVAFAALARHRILAAVARSGVSRPVPEQLAAALESERRTVALQAMAHMAVARRVSDALRSAAIPALFIKGIFQSTQMTGDYAFRGPGDIDVFVSPDSFDDVVDLMTARGAVHEQYEATPRLQERIANVHHATTLYLGRSHIDLHRRLDPVPHLMRSSFDEFRARRDTVELQGQVFPTLGAVDAAVFVASHGCQDNWPRLRQVVDFVLALDVASRESGFDAVERRARALGVARRFAVAVEVARRLVPELPAQTGRARVMAAWAWSRHRAGRLTDASDRARDSITTFAYWTLSQGDPPSLGYAVRRLLWLPSAMGDSPLPDAMWWAYPLTAPVNVVRRVHARSRT